MKSLLYQTMFHPHMSNIEYFFQAAVNEVFAIPDHVLLPEDAPQLRQYSEQEECQLDLELEGLMRRVKRVSTYLPSS